MFRVSFKLDGLTFQRTKAPAKVPAPKPETPRSGDWAKEMHAAAHERLTKEDICETFKDKFQPTSGGGRNKSVA